VPERYTVDDARDLDLDPEKDRSPIYRLKVESEVDLNEERFV
jgi:hypothetical protein